MLALSARPGVYTFHLRPAVTNQPAGACLKPALSSPCVYCSKKQDRTMGANSTLQTSRCHDIHVNQCQRHPHY
ncbi:hypothetical protein BgiBS90_022732, partial [Biomphalaria glabrata]